MLRLEIPNTELWDEKNQIFESIPHQVLQLEHSLVSISKWESKWCKSFFATKEKTGEEILDYIRCMTITPNVNPKTYSALNDDHFRLINEYIDAPMTATTFSDDKNQRPSREIITSELVYYWMIEFGVPVDFDKWHIARLMTLIRICSIKSQPSKSMSRGEILRQNAALNAARKKKHNTRG